MPDIKQTQDTRRAFVDTLKELSKKDDKIVVIIPDVGFNYLSDPNLPFRVLNLGVTEQSATIIAATLALSGFRVYFYSMINFVLFRNAEMVRNGIVCHKAPVTLLGVKGSSSYKFLGFSHNMLHPDEDINFCKNIGLKYYTPESNPEVRNSILDIYDKKIPAYIRL